MTSSTRRETRQAAAAEFKPAAVQLLLIAEAPPSAEERYFYFPNVSIHDSLFRYVARMTLDAEPTRGNKEELLGHLQALGVFLIDACLDPIADKSELRACVPDLVDRASQLAPKHIVLIKRTVWDAAYWPLRNAGLLVLEDMIPFPGSGQQLRFEASYAAALRSIGWTPGLGLGMRK